MNFKQKMEKIIKIAIKEKNPVNDILNLQKLFPKDLETILIIFDLVSEEWTDKVQEAFLKGYDDIYDYMEDPVEEVVLHRFSLENIEHKIKFRPIFEFENDLRGFLGMLWNYFMLVSK